MTIKELYAVAKVPPNLARHMLETATVGDAVLSRWIGSPIRSDALRKSLLVHDLGNLVKFQRPFLGEWSSSQEYWMTVQDALRSRFGLSAYDATLGLIREMSIDAEVTHLVEELCRLQQNEIPLGEVSWEVRIAEYADLCVSPAGIVGTQARIADIKERYQDSVTDHINRHTEELLALIEPQVIESVANPEQWKLAVPEDLYLGLKI